MGHSQSLEIASINRLHSIPLYLVLYLVPFLRYSTSNNGVTLTSRSGVIGVKQSSCLCLLIYFLCHCILSACCLMANNNNNNNQICDLRPREHVTSALIDLHWLPIAARIELKICMLVYKSLNSTAPAYISDMLQPVSSLQRQTNLRSATNSELCVPCTRIRIGERAFSSAATRR